MIAALSFTPGAYQKSSNFLQKEKRRFQIYSQTFASEVKEPKLRYQRPKMIHQMPYITIEKSRNSPKMLKLVTESKFSSPDIKPQNNDDDEITPTRGSFLGREATSGFISVTESGMLYEQATPEVGFQSQLAGIMNRCARLNRDMGRFEKKLTRTESRYFDSMTDLLKRSNKPQKFKLWTEDPNFLVKKKKLEEIILMEQAEAAANKEDSLETSDFIRTREETLYPGNTNETPAPELCEISETKHSVARKANVFSDKYSEKAASDHKAVRRTPIIINIRQRIGQNSAKGNNLTMDALPKEKISKKLDKINELTEEALWNQIVNIPRWEKSLQKEEQAAKRRNLNIQTYAVQEEDFLKHPFPHAAKQISKSQPHKKKKHILATVLKRSKFSEASELNSKSLISKSQLTKEEVQLDETLKINLENGFLKDEPKSHKRTIILKLNKKKPQLLRALTEPSKEIISKSEPIVRLVNVIHTVRNISIPLRKRRDYASLRERVEAVKAVTPAPTTQFQKNGFSFVRVRSNLLHSSFA